MTLRIGWLSPLTPASGVGTFSHAVVEAMPPTVDGEAIDVTLLHPAHPVLHRGSRRAISIEDTDDGRALLGLFDLLVYNIGNNTEHHDVIVRLLRTHPGIVICHDYVYQHYLADRASREGQGFASFAALMMKFGGEGAASTLARSRITNRAGRIRYSPWDSEACVAQPLSGVLLGLASAAVVHSRFAQDHVAACFEGPVLRLGMPHDQKAYSRGAPKRADTAEAWSNCLAGKQVLHLVSFGHVQATKCIDLVIEAIATAPRLRARLRYTVVGFVGDWDYFRRLEEQVAAAGLRDVVRFESGVSDARLGEITCDTDIFINLRKPNTEGSSASLIEQLDSGRPVVVLSSGCYAEVPDDAAVKLSAEAGAGEVRAALEMLAAQPDRLVAIGRAGRAYARRLTCAAYGERLVRFAFEHQDLLRRRGALVGRVARQDVPGESAWTTKLAAARASLRLLERNLLVVDPGLVTALDGEALCSYVAEVMLGIFDDPRLGRALARFFAGRTGRAAYWACVRFAMVADAAYRDDKKARARLASAGPWYDVEFWDVLESMPPAPYAAAATLCILGRAPSAEEVAIAGDHGTDGHSARRQLMLSVLRQAPDSEAATKLRRWLEQPCDHRLESELPAIESDHESLVGSAHFREHADLSGFFPQEADHAWTRGARGFIGLRLGRGVLRVELLVRNVNTDGEREAVVGLSSGTAAAEIVVRDQQAHCLALDIPRHLAGSDTTTWLQLSTSLAGLPEGSADPRVLGVCLMKLRVLVDPADQGRPLGLKAMA